MSKQTSIGALLDTRFDNGRELYHKSPLFHAAITQIALGQDVFKVLEQVIVGQEYLVREIAELRMKLGPQMPEEFDIKRLYEDR